MSNNLNYCLYCLISYLMTNFKNIKDSLIYLQFVMPSIIISSKQLWIITRNFKNSKLYAIFLYMTNFNQLESYNNDV